MSRYLLTFGLACGLVVGAGYVPAGAKAEDKKAVGKEKAISSKGQQYPSAATVAFGDKLGLPFPYLLTLGTRIEQARLEADPVGLMAAALELAVAEKVSEKKADLTSDVLGKEAVALAKTRGRTAELKALALMAPDAAAKKDLDAAVPAAQEQEAKEAENLKAIKAGERLKGIEHELRVYNESHHTVRVYVNGRYVGQVYARSHSHFHVHTHGHTDLRAVGGGLVWESHIDGDYENYPWTLNE